MKQHLMASINSSASVFLIVQVSWWNEIPFLVKHLWVIQPELKHFISSWRSRCGGKGNRHHLLCSGVLCWMWNCWNKQHLGISDSDGVREQERGEDTCLAPRPGAHPTPVLLPVTVPVQRTPETKPDPQWQHVIYATCTSMHSLSVPHV